LDFEIFYFPTNVSVEKNFWRPPAKIHIFSPPENILRTPMNATVKYDFRNFIIYVFLSPFFNFYF